MVANPEDLVRGQEVEGNAVITKSNSAIEAYRSGSNGSGGSAGTTTTSSPD